MRCAEVIATNLILFGSPRIALAISRAMSMSKPTIWLVTDPVAEQERVWSTPRQQPALPDLVKAAPAVLLTGSGWRGVAAVVPGPRRHLE